MYYYLEHNKTLKHNLFFCNTAFYLIHLIIMYNQTAKLTFLELYLYSLDITLQLFFNLILSNLFFFHFWHNCKASDGILFIHFPPHSRLFYELHCKNLFVNFFNVNLEKAVWVWAPDSELRPIPTIRSPIFVIKPSFSGKSPML